MPHPTGPDPLDARGLDAALGEAAHWLDRPLVVLRRDATLVWANACAHRGLIGPDSPWRRDPQGRVVPGDDRAWPVWLQALERADDTATELSDALPAGTLRSLGAPAGSREAWLLLLPTSVDAGSSRVSWADFARSFALSAEEAALLPALAGAQPLAQTAATMGLSVPALRGPLRAVLRKTQLPSLTLLRRQLQALPPLRRW
ncbi:MAG: hypothetical protein ACOVOT_12360 [Rubrivivax sp.]|jgi:hypothetical protein|nr:hypothetical protein [Rubrivivax sp.]